MRSRYSAFPGLEGDVAPPKTAIAGLNPLQWGTARTLNPPWAQDQIIGITSIDTPRNRVPVTQNMTLVAHVQNPSASAWDNGILRWILTMGVGGGSTQIEFDADEFQQISFSSSVTRVSLVVRAFNPFAPGGIGTPNARVDASVFATDMPTTTSEARFTNMYSIDSSLDVRPPAGATSVRLLGEQPLAATSPFVAGFALNMQAGGVSLDTYTGDYIEGIRLAPIPVPSNCQNLNISPPGAVVFGLEWLLDL